MTDRALSVFFLARERDMERISKEVRWLERMRGKQNNEIEQLKSSKDEFSDQALNLKTTNDSIAARVHALYNGVEIILKSVLLKFDEYVPQGDSWHRELLDQAALEIPNEKDGSLLRPAIIETDTLFQLDRLRAFRHFIRNVYGVDVETSKVADISQVAETAAKLFRRDIEAFKKFCLEIDVPVVATTLAAPRIPRAP